MKKMFLGILFLSTFAFQVNAKEAAKGKRFIAEEASIPLYFICDLGANKLQLWLDLSKEMHYVHDVKAKSTTEAQKFIIFGYNESGRGADLVFTRNRAFLEDIIPDSTLMPTSKAGIYNLNLDTDGDFGKAAWKGVLSRTKLSLPQPKSISCSVIKGFKIQVTPIK